MNVASVRYSSYVMISNAKDFITPASQRMRYTNSKEFGLYEIVVKR